MGAMLHEIKQCIVVFGKPVRSPLLSALHVKDMPKSQKVLEFT